jgi:hypothetical protein
MKFILATSLIYISITLSANPLPGWFIVQSFSNENSTVENRITLTDSYSSLENTNWSITIIPELETISIINHQLKWYWIGNRSEFNNLLTDLYRVLLAENYRNFSEELVNTTILKLQTKELIFVNDSLKKISTLKKWQMEKETNTYANYACTSYTSEVINGYKYKLATSTKVAHNAMDQLNKLWEITEEVIMLTGDHFTKSLNFISVGGIQAYPMYYEESNINSLSLLQKETVEVVEELMEAPVQKQIPADYQSRNIVEILIGAKRQN